ncbi:MAG: FRG domain-containing protein [Phycisphaerae bacterium]|nr:FRG domain-containing protein [Phycisphaerae bacterium]
MQETTPQPSSLRELLEQLDILSDLPHRCICRGQPDASWPLQPSIDRSVPDHITYSKRLDEERCLVEKFRHRAEWLLGEIEWRFVREAAPDDQIRPMTVMQHFGVPTRLLDWTKSPWMAAFFAAVEVDRWDFDGAVWWYSESAFGAAIDMQWERLNMRRTPNEEIDYNRFAFRGVHLEFIGPVYLKIPFARAEAQQALFTIGGTLGQNHEVLLSKLLKTGEFGKLIIPSRLKHELLVALKVRGLTATSLQHVGADRLGFSMAADLLRERTGTKT